MFFSSNKWDSPGGNCARNGERNGHAPFDGNGHQRVDGGRYRDALQIGHGLAEKHPQDPRCKGKEKMRERESSSGVGSLWNPSDFYYFHAYSLKSLWPEDSNFGNGRTPSGRAWKFDYQACRRRWVSIFAGWHYRLCTIRCCGSGMVCCCHERRFKRGQADTSLLF